MLRQQSARHFSGESFFAWEVTISLRLADISQALLCGLASHDKSLTISLHRTDTNFLRPHYSEFLQLYPPLRSVALGAHRVRNIDSSAEETFQRRLEEKSVEEFRPFPWSF